MVPYVMNYRRRFSPIARKVKVVGHQVDREQDKMVLFFADGGVKEVLAWSKCRVKLGADWVIAQKKSMEAQAGQTIPINREGV